MKKPTPDDRYPQTTTDLTLPMMCVSASLMNYVLSFTASPPSPDELKTAGDVGIRVKGIIDAMTDEGVPGLTHRACIAALISVVHTLHHMYVEERADDCQ